MNISLRRAKHHRRHWAFLFPNRNRNLKALAGGFITDEKLVCWENLRIFTINLMQSFNPAKDSVLYNIVRQDAVIKSKSFMILGKSPDSMGNKKE